MEAETLILEIKSIQEKFLKTEVRNLDDALMVFLKEFRKFEEDNRIYGANHMLSENLVSIYQSIYIIHSCLTAALEKIENKERYLDLSIEKCPINILEDLEANNTICKKRKYADSTMSIDNDNNNDKEQKSIADLTLEEEARFAFTKMNELNYNVRPIVFKIRKYIEKCKDISDRAQSNLILYKEGDNGKIGNTLIKAANRGIIE